MVSPERSIYGNDRGVVLVLALILLGALALLGTTAVLLNTTDSKIGGNYKASGKAIYVAEAGAQEARQRLRGSVADLIPDDDKSNALWKTYIGTEPKSLEKGFDSGDPNHDRVNSLQADMDYTVVITHQVDGDGNVLYFGDSLDGDGDFKRHTDATRNDPNIYLITSYGTAEGSTQTIQLEVTRVPPITIKGALYTGASTDIKGNVEINGNDSCVVSNKPGIATQQVNNVDDPDDPVSAKAGAITGSIGADPDVLYGVGLIKVQLMADFFKKSADFSYSVNTHTSYDADDIPGPGDGWGTPDLTVPTCSSCNIVYYDTNETSIELSGATGCGILVVDGDLDVKGGFKWYGTIIMTGAFSFIGGAGNNIVGAVISKGTADGDFFAGSGEIKYCSTATSVTHCHALIILSWKEVLAE